MPLKCNDEIPFSETSFSCQLDMAGSSEDRFHCPIDLDGQTLVVRWPIFGVKSKTRILPWHQGLSVINSFDGETSNQSLFEPLNLELFDWWDNDLSPWINSIPSELLRVTESFGSQRFEVLRLAANHPAAADLLLSNSLLLLLWFCHIRPRQPSAQEIEKILSAKQCDILASMKLVAKKATLKILRRVQLQSFNGHLMQTLLDICRDECRLKMLAHIPEITERHLLVASRCPWLIGCRLFTLLCSDGYDRPDRRGMLTYAEDVVHMAGPNAVMVVRRMSSFEQLKQYHDRLMREARIRRNQVLLGTDGKPLPFPDPPFSNGVNISAVTDYATLEKVSEQMEHCVATYAARIQRGSYCVYQLWGNDPVTIGFQYDVKSAQWQMDQVQGVGNQRPSPEAERIIMAWWNQVGKVQRDSNR